jgi:basic membrane protein A
LVRLWDADTGEHLRTLAGHSGAVTAVSLSPNGNRLATASEDGTVRLWDVATGQQLLNLLQAGTSIDDVTFSPDGAYLAASSANNVWVFLARVESLAALARSRATRPLSPSECTRFLHLPPESCPGAPTRPTVTPLAAIAAHRLCQVTDPPEWAYDLTVERTGDGVEAAAAGLSWEATVLYPASMVDIAAKTAQLSASDCDLIVAPIYNGSAAIEAAAQRNPGRKYLIWEGIAPRTLPNLWVQTYATHQAAFLAGYAAASVSQTGKVGTFGGTAYPAVLAFMDGFALGVAHYNLQHAQHVEVLGWNVDQQDGLFIGGFCCEAEGAAWANQLLAGGADVILPVAGTQVGQGAAQAVQQHGNAYVIGVDVDYALALPGGLGAAVLTSIEKRQDVSVGLAATAVALGSFSGGLHVGTLASGEVGLSPFYDHASLISDRLTAELEQISADIIAGHLKTSP